MLDPNDRRFNPPAVVQEARVKSEVPPATDIMGTMRYWDDYRKKERARIDAVRDSLLDEDFAIDPDLGTLVSPEALRAIGLKLGEKPSSREIKEAKIRKMWERVWEEGAEPDWLLVTPEVAYAKGVISYRRLKWLQFKRAVRGIWKRRGRSGARSARPTRGTTGPAE